MTTSANLIEENKKNNTEKNNYSIGGFLWSEKKTNNDEVVTLKNELGLDTCIAKLAVARDINSKNFEKYTNPKIKTTIPDPFVLDDMQKATKKIVNCILKKKKIGVFGDYDVDGSSATSLICNFFSEIGVEYESYIPDRINEGYGANIDAFELLKEKGCALILTLDCGTTSFEPIELISRKNVDVIVVDHHQQSELLPKAFAIINPKKKKDSSNLNNLCATGVTFFLVISLSRELKKNNSLKIKLPNLIKYLDLVALATVCDLVKLDQVNRAFVKQGIKIINQTNNIGLNALVQESSINQFLNEYHLGFVLGPRINAGGRVGNSRIGVDLLTSNDTNMSNILSKKLCDFNNLRKSIEYQVEKEAINQVIPEDQNIICVHNNNWHPGVLGIVASKLTNKFMRPSIVISEDNEICSASCRSVSSFDIGKFILDSVKNGMLTSGGGHKMAGGFKIKRSKIKDFKLSLKNKFVTNVDNLKKNYDSELKISAIDNQLFHKINKFSPFGIGNPKPKFLINDVVIRYPRVVGEKHISFYFEDYCSTRIKAISFDSLGTKLGDVIKSSDSIKSAVVSINLNTWDGQENAELILEDIII